MQAQSTRQQTSITPQQSVTVIKTLLSASFGCIAYLRNLLPEDNFGEGRLMSSEKASMSYESMSMSQESTAEDTRHRSSIKIKTVVRGYSEEANKLLDCLEKGIFDAMEKQYLKSFIFAIYLDNQDPNNIVEAYTYNFSYYTVPGTDLTVPIMSLDETLSRMSIGKNGVVQDPVTAATLRGQAPTLGEVKRSLKSLIKTLITIMQSLDPLPKRRFATFKLIYRDHTPADYEPPYFRPGDAEKDKFIFTTHRKSEIPEKFSVGSLTTPYHNVDLKVESIAHYLPSAENDNRPYAGLSYDKSTKQGHTAALTDVSSRLKQIEVQSKDAEERVVVWDADGLSQPLTDQDAEGESDLEYISKRGSPSAPAPLGIRTSDGGIVSVESRAPEDMEVDGDRREIVYGGQSESAPSHVGQLIDANGVPGVTPTQIVDATQIIPETPTDLAASARTVTQEHQTPTCTETMNTMQTGTSHGIDTQLLQNMVQNVAEETAEPMDCDEVLNLETQVPDAFYNEPARTPLDEEDAPRSPKRAAKVPADESVNCSCELSTGDGFIQCEGQCEKWYHAWCMGYHSTEDHRLPDKFICLECSLTEDPNFALISDIFADILTKFAELALFRHAIKQFEFHQPENMKAFKKLLDCKEALAKQLWNRLELENFIVPEVTDADSMGLMETRTRGQTKQSKKKKGKNSVVKYIFNTRIKQELAYINYFSPDSEAEKAMLGLKGPAKEKNRKKTDKRGANAGQPLAEVQTNVQSSVAEPRPVQGARTNDTPQHPVDESQTQDTQFPAPVLELKRKSTVQNGVKAAKKVKISLGDGIDIEE